MPGNVIVTIEDSPFQIKSSVGYESQLYGFLAYRNVILLVPVRSPFVYRSLSYTNISLLYEYFTIRITQVQLYTSLMLE